jgi:predicted aspartyl protease
MTGIGQILVITALTMSGSAVVYVGSVTATFANFAESAHEALADPSNISLPGKPVRLQRRSDGLFHLRVTFDGISTTAILDTGASRSVIGKATLNRLARRNGHIFAKIKRDGVMLTLSGNVDYRLASVSEVQAEGFSLGNLHAATIDSPDVPTVLGQDAISRFRSVTIEGDELVLR